MTKLCLILNLAPHYRKAIYQAIDQAFDCDWYVGDHIDDIKTIQPEELKNCTVIKNKQVFKNNYIQKGMLGLLFDRRYHSYLVTGEVRNISLWAFLILSKFLPRKKVYTWTHGNNGKGSKFGNLVKNFFEKLSDGTFVYGNYAREYMLTQGINPNKLFVIHNSLDYEKQLECRKKLMLSDIYKAHFGNSDKNLIFIGRLTTVKRLDLLIEMMCLLFKRGRYFNLTLVGDGVEKDRLVECVQKYGLSDRVWFYGACYDEYKNAELIYNADICVSPGNVGLTAIHSLMFGTPVATHNNFLLQMPEFEAVIEGETGTFFNHLDVVSMAEKIENWFENGNYSRERVRLHCMKEVDSQWTPQYQVRVIKENIQL